MNIPPRRFFCHPALTSVILTIIGILTFGCGSGRNDENVNDGLWPDPEMAALALDRIGARFGPLAVEFDGDTMTIDLQKGHPGGDGLAREVCTTIADLPGIAGINVRVVDAATNTVLGQLDHPGWPIVLSQATC